MAQMVPSLSRFLKPYRLAGIPMILAATPRNPDGNTDPDNRLRRPRIIIKLPTCTKEWALQMAPSAIGTATWSGFTPLVR